MSNPAVCVSARPIEPVSSCEAQVQRLTQLYTALSHCNQAIVRCTSEAELFSEICRTAVEFGGMKMAWIGMLNASSTEVETFAFHGMSQEYVAGIRIVLSETASLTHDPVRTVILENKPVWCQDFQNESFVVPSKERAAKNGWSGVAALPLHRDGKVVGAFTLYTTHVHAFDQAARDLLTEMAGDVDFALDNFQRERTRQQMEQALRDSENRFRDLFQKAPLPYHSLDIEGNILEVNEKWLSLLGYKRDEVIGRFFGDFVTDDSAAHPVDEFPRFKSSGNIEGALFEMLCKDGSRRLWLVNGQIARDGDGNFLRTHCIYTDVTERRKDEEQFLLAAKVFQQSSEGFMITDAENRIVMVNSAFTDITGYGEDEVVGCNPSMLSSGHQKREFYQSMWNAISSAGYWQGEVLNRKKGGGLYLARLSISPILDPAGLPAQYIGTFSDITKHRAAEEKLNWLMHFDKLTGLPNRTLLDDRCKLAISMAQRSGTGLALMFLDIDNFKNINEALGYQTGDSLISILGHELTSSLRAQDTVSRIGGDDFVILLPNTGADGAAHLAEKLLNKVTQPQRLEGNEISMTASIGIAVYPDNGYDLDTLSRCAESAMYRAKLEGRNTFRFFTREMQEHVFRTLQLGNALHRALENDEFDLHYQPQVSLETGQTIGAEALLRWTSPSLGPVSPSEFIPVAEGSGHILSIGEWVLRAAARQMKGWLDEGWPLATMAVNISLIQFRQPDLPERLMAILAETGLAPQYLELELTESVAMEDPAAAVAIVKKLRGYGMRIAIDDFGTGHSSLGHLKRFNADKLKIDRSFIRDIAIDPDDRAIVRAIINMASSLGLKTVAEGVETEQQLEYLRSQGCNEAQGYYYSRPVPACEFERLLNSGSFLSGDEFVVKKIPVRA